MNTLGKKRSAPNPRAKAGWFSRLTHWYLNGLFKKGFKGHLDVSDMYEVQDEFSTQTAHSELKVAWNKELQKNEKGGMPSLTKALISISWKTLIFAGFFAFLEEGCKVLMPFLLGRLLMYFSEGKNTMSTRDAYLYSTGIALSSLLATVAHHPFFFMVQMLGLKLRAACTALLYDKLLKLNPSSLAKITVGHVTNLASTDCQKILLTPSFLNYLWLAPLQLCIVTYLLYRMIGYSAFAGIGVLLFQIPFFVLSGKMYAFLRRKVAVLTDKRVGIMSEVLSAMRVIKMYTWEASFAKLISEARRKEARKVAHLSIMRALNRIFPYTIPITAGTVTFVVHYLRGEQLILADVLSSVALINSLRISLVLFVPLAIQQAMEGYVAVRRIQKFLELGNFSEMTSMKPEDTSIRKHFVTMHQFTASRHKDMNEKALKDISLDVNDKNRFCMVIGPVGSGKSSLLAGVLGEMEKSVGTLTVQGRVAYVSQQAWIFSGTVRQNILFGKPFDLDKFRKIVHACALDEDLLQLPKADSTLVGERGVSLSGGQKARVSLARAIYHDADIYLLDDPLSAVDTRVGRHIFEQCFCGLLAKKLKILVTHQLQFLGYATEVICLQQGAIVSRGTYAELLESGVEIASLISDEDPGKDWDTDSAIDADEIRSGSFIHPDHGPRRRLVSKTSLSSLSPGRGLSFRSRSNSESSASVYHVNLAFSQEDANEEDLELLDQNGDLRRQEEKARGGIKASVYKEYLFAGINFLGFLLLLLLSLVAQFSIFLEDWWLAYWAENEEKRALLLSNQTLSAKFYFTEDPMVNLYIYVGFSASSVLLITLRGVFLALTLVSASRVLHDRMFSAILKAPIYFFDTNPVGRILNRFSKDVYFMDDELPIKFLSFWQILLYFVMIIIVNVVSIPYILLVVAPFFAIFIIIRIYYIRTSREVKRLEAISRSPLFSHLAATLQGLSSIRAYKVQDDVTKEFFACQDHQSEGWFLFLASSRWFGFRLDFLATIFVAFTVFAPVVLKQYTSVNNSIIALALAYALQLTGSFQWCVQQSTEVENMMTSVERVIQYSDLAPEVDEGTNEEIDENWPKYGLITAELASFSYHESLPYVLKNLFFCIRANEKVGVVGRTGAGKSSLISMLFRMAHISGTVRIDGVDTSDVKLKDLRSKISVIPQDPVLFSGTLRKNLDPFDEFTDADVWNALDEVQLKDIVLEMQDKLHSQLLEEGSNFSVGQRQLLCLCRAILRKTKIMIIDEATANVDHETDALIQETIREKFRNCTVITVAHRLNTVVDSDRVMVLNEGKMVEFDEPIELLRRPDSAFRQLVEQAGKITAARLMLLAEEARDYRQIEIKDNELNYPGRGITKSRTKEELLQMFGTKIVYETSL